MPGSAPCKRVQRRWGEGDFKNIKILCRSLLPEGEKEDVAMPDNPTNDTEAPERKLPEENTDSGSRSNSGKSGRTESDNRSLEEQRKDE
jgi:hypothetical protein